MHGRGHVTGATSGPDAGHPDAFHVGPDGEPDKYELVRQFGAGGEAQLWQAVLRLAGEAEPVAVKVLRTEHDDDFDSLSARWAEQAELLRFVRHPGVVGVREHFEGAPAHPLGAASNTFGRSLYLVMNWVTGRPVRDWILVNSGPDAVLQTMNHLEQVAEVLDWLHSGQATPSGRAVVHGDLSPGNVMINDAGQAILVDFGLVRIAAHHTVHASGTPGYAAPEVWRSGAYSPAADRYAFGAVACFMLTGEDPPPDFASASAHLAGIPAIAHAGAQRFDVLTRMFSDDPAQRPGAVEWVRALRSGASVTARAAVAGAATGPDRSSAPTVVAGAPATGAGRSGSSRRTLLVGLTAVGAITAAGIGYAVAASAGTDPAASAPPATASAPTATPPILTASAPPSTSRLDPSATSGLPPSTSAAGNAAPGSGAYLADEQPVERDNAGVYTEPATVDGVTYLHPLGTYHPTGRSALGYDLGRRYSRFQATVGLRDDADPDSRKRLEVYGDGRLLRTLDVSLGLPQDVDVAIDGVLRLQLVHITVNEGFASAYVIWGDARLIP